MTDLEINNTLLAVLVFLAVFWIVLDVLKPRK